MSYMNAKFIENDRTEYISTEHLIILIETIFQVPENGNELIRRNNYKDIQQRVNATNNDYLY